MRRGQGDDGGAVLELALMLPFLVIIVFGTIDLARAYTIKNKLTNMAREGAHYAQFQPGRITCADGVPTDITRAVKAEDASIASPTVKVFYAGTLQASNTCTSPGASPGTQVRVQVEAPMTVLTPIARQFTGTNSTVTVTGFEDVVVQGWQ